MLRDFSSIDERDRRRRLYSHKAESYCLNKNEKENGERFLFVK